MSYLLLLLRFLCIVWLDGWLGIGRNSQAHDLKHFWFFFFHFFVVVDFIRFPILLSSTECANKRNWR